MRKRPLLAVCVFFIIAIVLSSFFNKTSKKLTKDHIIFLLKEKSQKIETTGIIRSPVLKRRPYFGKIRSDYLFEIEGLKGLARICIKDEREYRYGDRIFIKGVIKKPPSFNSFDYRSYLERHNIFAIINTKGKDVNVLSSGYRGNLFLKKIYSIRNETKNLIIKKMPLDSGAFLRAIMIGDRSELSDNVKTSFKNSGTMHMIAISGLHIGIITLVVLYFFKIITMRREIAYILTILFLIFFAILTLLKPSVVRAVVMASMFLIGRLLGRRVDAYNSLGAAALFILIKNPKELYDAGFQLSFVAVLSILYFSPRIIKMVKVDINPYLKRYVVIPLAVSFSAWVGTFPFILYYFKMFVPIAIVSNLVIIPILFVEVIVGLLFIALGWVPYLGNILAWVNNVLILIIFNISYFFS